MDGGVWRKKGSGPLGVDDRDGVENLLLQEPCQRETVKPGLGWFCHGFWTLWIGDLDIFSILGLGSVASDCLKRTSCTRRWKNCLFGLFYQYKSLTCSHVVLMGKMVKIEKKKCERNAITY